MGVEAGAGGCVLVAGRCRVLVLTAPRCGRVLPAPLDAACCGPRPAAGGLATGTKKNLDRRVDLASGRSTC